MRRWLPFLRPCATRKGSSTRRWFTLIPGFASAPCNFLRPEVTTSDAHSDQTKLRACIPRRRLSSADRPVVAAWGRAPSGQARCLGERAGPEHRAKAVVRPRARTLRGVPPTLHRGAPRATPAAHGPAAPGARGHAHARLLRP